MKLLVLAPQPFYQERGTPIAVRLALQVLAARVNSENSPPGLSEITLFTYHEGQEVSIPPVKIERMSAPAWLKGIGPGISCKKIWYDLFFLFGTLKLLWSRRKNQFDLIHAVEESVFIAWLAKQLFGIPYVYDMDSSLSLQITEKWKLAKICAPLLEFVEGLAVKSSLAVVPVCDALAAVAEQRGSKETFILRDVSLLNESSNAQVLDLRSELKLPADAQLILYIGNLEAYQGIDLLLAGFENAHSRCPQAHLVIIGGQAGHIDHYQTMTKQLGIENSVSFMGPRPVDSLNSFINQADILASPRIKGNNTPMKIYSYLHSGRAIVATDMPTHTQVLSSEVAELCAPTPEGFSRGLEKLLTDVALRQRLGRAAQKLAEANYTFEVFKARLDEMYDRLSFQIEGSAVSQAGVRVLD